MGFVEALNMRMQDVASMCVGCGKCFEVSPMKERIRNARLRSAKPSWPLRAIMAP
jgi:ferredoxin